MAKRRFFSFKFLLFFISFLGVLYLGRALWLPLVPRPLIHDDGPGKAETAVVLAGDNWGRRILKAGDLVRAGDVPSVIVSGPAGSYGYHECDLAIPFAVARGYPKEWFVPLPHSALSTREEADVVLEDLRRRGVHSFLLVTSDYHTARSARIFRSAMRRMGGGPDMRVVAAPDEHFHCSDWWRNREGMKTVFIEWCKTVATAMGI